MFIWRKFKIRDNERGLRFRDGVFVDVLRPGTHRFIDPLFRLKVQVVSVRQVVLRSPDLDVMVKSGALDQDARIVNLIDKQRAIVHVDGRFERILEPGLHALWNVFHEVEVDVIDASRVRLESDEVAVISQTADAELFFEKVRIETGCQGLFFVDGEFIETLEPGVHAFWKGVADFKVNAVDLRQQVTDLVGQEIMTADKVTLRLNAVFTHRVVDPLKSVTVCEDVSTSLHRDAQLVLRAAVGTRKLETLLSDKDSLADELFEALSVHAEALGLKIDSFGIRDIILPGDMKDLMNKVMEAQKAAEANLIARREETAAMRSQANTARILESNQTLMRLRELELLEKIAGNTNLRLVLTDKGLSDRVLNIL